MRQDTPSGSGVHGDFDQVGCAGALTADCTWAPAVNYVIIAGCGALLMLWRAPSCNPRRIQ